MLSCHTLSVVSKLSVVSGGANTPLSHSIKLHMRHMCHRHFTFQASGVSPSTLDF